MTASNPFCTQLGILPIIQAPMAGVSTPQLAAAVSNAGGLGSLGLGGGSVDQGRQMITQTRALTPRAFNVNLFCHVPAVRDAQVERAWLEHLAPFFAEFGAQPPQALHEIYRSFLDGNDMLEMLIAEQPAVVSFHFGVPARPQVAALQAAGIYTMASATNLREARLAEAAGVDALIAQGIEAGGHRGMFDPAAVDEKLSTAVLVRWLVKNSPLPVIAAGGIMDGQGIRAALDLGASAAQLGTAFILCPESAANAGYRAALGSEKSAHTLLTAALSGRPARGIVNRFIAHCEKHGPAPAAYPVAYDAAKQLMAAASMQENHDFAAFWAGQGAPLARAMPAAQLMECLSHELAQTPAA